VHRVCVCVLVGVLSLLYVLYFVRFVVVVVECWFFSSVTVTVLVIRETAQARGRVGILRVDQR